MAFKFNFSLPEDGHSKEDSASRENNFPIDQNNSLTAQGKTITEIFVNDDHYKLIKSMQLARIIIGSAEFITINASDVEKHCASCDAIVESVKTHSDLIAGKYEGGLKIWEGSEDLCAYLQSTDIEFNSKKVLELGCGAGLPGIYALQKGACVHFQDFNGEVLDFMTIPNILLNRSNNQQDVLNCRFYAGDWINFFSLLTHQCLIENDKYDVILTSETIYNPQHHEQLYNIMKSFLKDNGVVYVAAKSYYFGLGGGILQFEELIQRDGFFDCTTCWNTDKGLKRVILKLTRKTL